MKQIACAVLTAAMLIGGSAAQAQTVEVGPGGVGVDLRGPRARDRDFEREDRFRERRRADRDYGRGGGDCREVTVTRRNEYGERVTRTRRECC